jgi:hypothetical protein
VELDEMADPADDPEVVLQKKSTKRCRSPAGMAGMGGSNPRRCSISNDPAYSPYENVRVQSYKAILALAGLTDPRVLYWEPAKWIARLRCLRAADRRMGD